MSAEEPVPPDRHPLVDELGLEPHPEGGWYRRTWRHEPDEGRGTVSSIHYLLHAGERSRWHRIDATEVWLHHAGGRLELLVEGAPPVVLGADPAAGHRLQAVVPPGAWQMARPLDEHVLVSCVVAPAFTFDTFELADEGWAPPGWTPEGDRTD